MDKIKSDVALALDSVRRLRIVVYALLVQRAALAPEDLDLSQQVLDHVWRKGGEKVRRSLQKYVRDEGA